MPEEHAQGHGMEILHRDTLPPGGFAGLREHRLVMDARAFGAQRDPGAWEGIGNFVYLADARFLPRGETRLHSHREIDVISVMVAGRIAHEGSLQHGQELRGKDVQVQRAGGEGFSHNEVNPDDSENRMIQLWVLPEQPGKAAGYRSYRPEPGHLTRVYGGPTDQEVTFDSHTLIDVGLLEPGQSVTAPGPCLAYLVEGTGLFNDTPAGDGDLVRGKNLTFSASTTTQLVLVHLAQPTETGAGSRGINGCRPH
jgi:redox-sensitive bicupin YhaK (pirin superfamily)